MADRYHRETWVREQIENWTGAAPGGFGGGAWATLEALGQLIDCRQAQAHIPRDPSHALRTSAALDALAEVDRKTLVFYHTMTTLTVRQLAHAVGIGKSTVDDKLKTAHVRFCEGWEQAKWQAIQQAKAYQQVENDRLKTRASACVSDNPH